MIWHQLHRNVANRGKESRGYEVIEKFSFTSSNLGLLPFVFFTRSVFSFLSLLFFIYRRDTTQIKFFFLMHSKNDIIIIGGGAAGIFAAINTAKKKPKTKISVFEASKKLLSKVLISGGGRCNVTNYTLDPKELTHNYPRGGKELLGPFTTFGVKETMGWFDTHGVALKVEKDKRVFPKSNTSQTIADCLLEEAKNHNISIHPGEKVYSISKDKTADRFFLKTNTSEHTATSVLIASGGNEKSFSLAESLGHRIVPPVPSLFTFTITDPLITDLAGISFQEVEAKLPLDSKKFRHRAPLLITHWGLSGPAIIVLSSKAARVLHQENYNTKLHINFIPRYSLDEAKEILTNFRSAHLQKQLTSLNPFSLPASFWQRLISILFSEENLQYQELSKTKIDLIVQKLSSCCFTIQGKGVFKEEFVTAGGVSLKEVNFKTMESKLVKNLFFAGEVLDIDGVTGGFNFQSAWTTAWIASQNIMR